MNRVKCDLQIPINISLRGRLPSVPSKKYSVNPKIKYYQDAGSPKDQVKRNLEPENVNYCQDAGSPMDQVKRNRQTQKIKSQLTDGSQEYEAQFNNNINSRLTPLAPGINVPFTISAYATCSG